MNFIFKMAWRDSRASRGRLLLASSSIVLGIAALVAIASFNDNLITSIDNATGAKLGLLVNFGHSPQLEWERIVK